MVGATNARRDRRSTYRVAMPSRRPMSASNRTCPEASSSNQALERAIALSSAGSTLRDRWSPAAMMMRVSTPRRFILRGTKRDKFKMLLVLTPAREQGISIPSAAISVAAQFNPADEPDQTCCGIRFMLQSVKQMG